MKRKRNKNSPETNNRLKKRQTLVKDYWLGTLINTKNTFQVLDETEKSQQSAEETSARIKTFMSPPIYISGVNNIRPLKDLLDEIAKDQYTIKVLTNNEVKIQSLTTEKFLPICTELKENNTQFYTFQKKQDKPYKVVLRNMHPSVEITDLKNEIENHGHEVIRITNSRQNVTQKPLPLFFVEIKAGINNK